MDLSRLGSVLLTRRDAATDVGLVRFRNEDSWLASPSLFAVTDGMGGHVKGALASSIAMRVLGGCLSADASGGWRADLVDLGGGVRQAAQAVTTLADPEDPTVASGSTLTGVLILDTERGSFWLSFNVEDLRTYIIGGDSIRQVTRDHSAVQEARSLAGLTGEELVFPPSSVITRALGAGMAAVPDADYALVPLSQGDYALMCSDGTHGVLDDEMIVQTVRSGGGPQQITNELVDAVITSSTHGNATAVVVHALRVSWVGDVREVHSRQIQAVRPMSTTAVHRGVN